MHWLGLAAMLVVLKRDGEDNGQNAIVRAETHRSSLSLRLC